jgi:ATP-dependent DNA ligase
LDLRSPSRFVGMRRFSMVRSSASTRKAGRRFYDLIRRRAPQHFYAFDLIWLDGEDLVSCR